MNNWAESLFIVEPKLLGAALSNQSGLVSFHGSISINLSLENPLVTDNLPIGWWLH